MKAANDMRQIKGWGVDADPENNPVYPIKQNRETDEQGMDWQRPSQQHQDVEILKSVERPNLSAAFGTSTPPSGLSGMIRRFAFKRSESTYGRWFPLMLADRINVVEGIFQDLWRGHIPNIPREMGIRAELKYNPKGFAMKVGGVAMLSLALIIFLNRKKLRQK